jgi:hypothetical protein
MFSTVWKGFVRKESLLLLLLLLLHQSLSLFDLNRKIISKIKVAAIDE